MTSNARAQRLDAEPLSELVERIRFAMVTTVDREGRLQSRPMPPQRTDADGTLWFIASRRGSLVDELRAQPAILITYRDTRSRRYVSISGVATVLRDAAKAAELWDAAIRHWFPDGPNDPEVAVIRVDVATSQYRHPLPAPVAFPQFMQAAAGRASTHQRSADRSAASRAPVAREA